MSPKPPKPVTVKGYTKEDVLVFLENEIKRLGSQAAFARAWGMSPTYVSEVVSGSRDPGPKILTAFRLAERKLFVPVPDDIPPHSHR